MTFMRKLKIFARWEFRWVRFSRDVYNALEAIVQSFIVLASTLLVFLCLVVLAPIMVVLYPTRPLYYAIKHHFFTNTSTETLTQLEKELECEL